MAAKLVIKNSDPGKRSFTVGAIGIDVAVNPGREKAIELRDLPAGAYTFICRIFRPRRS